MTIHIIDRLVKVEELDSRRRFLDMIANAIDDLLVTGGKAVPICGVGIGRPGGWEAVQVRQGQIERPVRKRGVIVGGVMVEDDVRARGVRDETVLRAMDAVPREAFVPESQRAQAYFQLARSYYRNGSGRSAVNCPFTGTEMWHRMREPDFGGDLTVT